MISQRDEEQRSWIVWAAGTVSVGHSAEDTNGSIDEASRTKTEDISQGQKEKPKQHQRRPGEGG